MSAYLTPLGFRLHIFPKGTRYRLKLVEYYPRDPELLNRLRELSLNLRRLAEEQPGLRLLDSRIKASGGLLALESSYEGEPATAIAGAIGALLLRLSDLVGEERLLEFVHALLHELLRADDEHDEEEAGREVTYYHD